MRNNRYSRLKVIEGIGESGIEKLGKGKILIIGCGALGSLCGMYLAASGIGGITLADFDTVDLSNLQRQLFFEEDQLGESKLKILATRMRSINSDIEVTEFEGFITPSKAESLFPEYHFIVDCSDNPATKLMTSRICERLGTPYCIGGVREFAGQVMTWTPGHIGYGEIFGDVDEDSGLTPCSYGGVIGPAAGVVASVQAAEVLKYLTKCGELLTDRLFIFDLSSLSASIPGIS